MWLMTMKINTVYKIILIFACVNFAVFWFIAFDLGGDAFNGKYEDGHYYLADHGRITEVSKQIWWYSRVHAISVFFTHPLALLCGLLLIVNKQETRSGK